ncbi:MAG: hypothetical protein LBL95_03665 [Deltaproteobacteria bacterium]|nr:hypothetical protein [Deltaproteobacteria bacterium]
MEINDSSGISPAMRQKLDELLKLLIEHFRETGTPADIDEVKENVKLILDHQIKLDKGTSDVSNFMTMGQIEQMMLELRAYQNDANVKALLYKMRDVKADSKIVDQKKIIPYSNDV